MKEKRIKAWGGFVDGKLDMADYICGGSPHESAVAVFKSRSLARRAYEDVRPVYIVIPEKPEKKVTR